MARGCIYCDYPSSLPPSGCPIHPLTKDPRAAEVEQVKAVALDVIVRVMKEGAATHAVGEWREVGNRDHLLHATNHVANSSWVGAPRDRTEIEHAIVRLLFIVANKRSDDAVAKQKEDGE